MIRVCVVMCVCVGVEVVHYKRHSCTGSWDRLGKLELTRDGLKRRNQLVLQTCLEAGCPVVVTMGGGDPSDGDLTSVVQAHQDVYVEAAQMHAFKQEQQLRDLASES